MIRSNRRSGRVTVRSQLNQAVERLHEGEHLSAGEALVQSLVGYARERPEVVVACCFIAGFWLGRKLSL